MNTNLNSWDVQALPVFANNNKINNYKAIARTDNSKILNIAKHTYTPTQNSRFVEVVEKLSETTGFPIKNYSEFQGGSKVMAFLKCTDTIQVLGHEFKDFMLIGNAHDSSSGFFIGSSSVMVRCANQFSKIFKNLSVKHTRNHDKEIEQIIGSFGLFMAERKKLAQKFENFERVKIDDGLKNALVYRLNRMTNEEILGNSETSTRKQNNINSMLASIERECKDLGDNLFGLLNGITHYTTHHRSTKENVFCNAVGTNAVMNESAFAFCEEFESNWNIANAYDLHQYSGLN